MSTPTPSLQPLSPTSAPGSATRWIPIRSLATRHRGRILTHLLALPDADRYLRFGYSPSDEQIHRYVETLDFERDEIFGIFNRRLELIAMAHLAYEHSGRHPNGTAEFGVSVSSSARGRGIGARMFDHAVMHARNRGVDRMVIHALSENTAMLRIVRRAGAEIERQGSETTSTLTLPPETLGTVFGAMVARQAAEWDYGLKRQALRPEGKSLPTA